VFIDNDDKTLVRGVIAPDAGVVTADELVVRGVEEPLEFTGSGTPEKSCSV
jgi:hypothetical protein